MKREINPRINVVIANPRVVRNIGPPVSRILAPKVVADPRETLIAHHLRIRVSARNLHSDHRSPTCTASLRHHL